ncbi:MAG: ABC transporter ATP-binding protein, partial [Desulfurococcales archaeon]|nr:ABC transporter ATP-binding protein [Desulfurococcales archaeon]
MASTVLLVEDVWKRYGRVEALRGASLTLERGEILGLLGPNGAGKTTLLKVVLGLARRDRGRVELLGVDPLRSPRARRRVGVIFERPTLPDSMPVRELLEHAARIHGSGRGMVDEAIEVAGLGGHEWKRFSMLSAGLKQRAAIAHAMVADPEVLIADEPTSNLDPVERARILELLARLNSERGLTILVSSHVVSEVLRVSTR